MIPMGFRSNQRSTVKKELLTEFCSSETLDFDEETNEGVLIPEVVVLHSLVNLLME